MSNVSFLPAFPGQVFGGGQVIGTCDNWDMVFEANSLKSLWLKTTGKVGIGVGASTPSGQLDIVTSGTTNGLNVLNGTTNLFSVGSDGTTIINTTTGANNPFTVQKSGVNLFQVSSTGVTLSSLVTNGNVTINGSLTTSAHSTSSTGYNSLLVDVNGKLVVGGSVYGTASFGWNVGGNSGVGATGTLGTNDGNDLIIVAGGTGGTSPGIERMRISAATGNIALKTGEQITFRDANHGIGFFDGTTGTGSSGLPNFGTGTKPVNGPVVYGYGGGALGSITGAGAVNQIIALQWNNNGQVFIGSKSPNSNNTHSGAKLAVSGDIVTTAIYVTDPATKWADFVFDKNYKVMQLSELENFYKTNHHLPDVPTTKQIQENGIDLAKTDAILLQKIEELTLYLVEQNRAMELLKKENEDVKKMVQKLLK